VTWIVQRVKFWRTKRGKMKHKVKKKVGGVVGTYNGKPQTLLKITHILSVSLDFLKQNMELSYNFD